MQIYSIVYKLLLAAYLKWHMSSLFSVKVEKKIHFNTLSFEYLNADLAVFKSQAMKTFPEAPVFFLML